MIDKLLRDLLRQLATATDAEQVRDVIDALTALAQKGA